VTSRPETHELRRQVGGEDVRQRFRVAPGIELGVPRGVAGRVERPGHRDVAPDLGFDQVGFAPQREGEPGERPQRDQRDRLGAIGQHALQRPHVVEHRPGGRDGRVAQS
jgi:hypothetical protein